MATLREALNLLGYSEEQSKSLVQIFHITGVFDGKTHNDKKLTEVELEAQLQSNLGISEGADALSIAQEFNRLGQEKFKKIRGGGERQEMSSISIPETGFMTHFEALSMSQEKDPKGDVKLYFIFGASEDGLRNRIEFLKEKLGEDINSKDVIFLGGDRKLWPKYTEDNEYLLRSVPGEEVTFKLIAELNPDLDIKEIKKQINQFFEKTKQDLIDGKINITQIRKKIIEEMVKGVKWPTESDLEKYLAKEMLGIEEARVIEGEIDPKIGRPTTETTLQAIPRELSHIVTSQPEACFVSSQPHMVRQVSLAKSLSGLKNVTGCGRGAPSLLDHKNTAPMLEATLGEVNSLCKIKEKEKELETSSPNLKKKVYDFLKGSGLTNGCSSIRS